ncbi:hypothetical protein KJ877_08080 [bacterium]|nr:hypothetical protein [bacterium]MBU1990965.1 hypothetical protein [bacterium]
MKFVILISLIALSLSAQTDKQRIFGHVVSDNADLYKKPYECSEKRLRYFNKGDVIQIDYCNQYKWCKTKNGYVKKDLLRLNVPKFETPMVKEDLTLKDNNTTFVQNTSVEKENNTSFHEDITIIEVTNQTDTVHSVHTINASVYDEYFSPESAKIVFKDPQ